MEISFAMLCEQLDKEKKRPSPLMDSGEEERAMTVVRSGMDMHEEGESSIWQEFMSLCSNSDGMAQLLNVSPEKVRGWPGRIREIIDKIESQEQYNPSEKKKAEMMPTGENGAFTTNVDPTNIGDVT